MPPVVSVLVTNYNHARFLRRRLDSILGQTFQPIEIIVLDDASSDNSRDLMKDYAQRHSMQLVFNESNSGSPFIQWRRGAQLAMGKYIWIAESDDFADPRLLEVLVSRMEARPNVGLVYCQSFLVDENDRVTGKYNFIRADLNPSRWDRDFDNNGRDEVANYLFSQNTIPNASAVLVNKSLLLSASEHTADMRLMGDWWTWARVLMESDVSFVAEPLNFFRMHATSVRNSTRRAVACAEAFRVMAHISSRVKVPSAIRRRAVREGFGGVWAYLDSPTTSPDAHWCRDVLRSAEAIHWSARSRLVYLKIKHQLKRIPFLTRTVRCWRRIWGN